MTKREFYEIVIAQMGGTEVAEFAQSEINKMNARNEKRSTTPSKTQRENEPIKAQILASVGDGMTAKMIGETVGITTQKASALARQLVDCGKFVATDEKVDKRIVKVYRLA